MRKAPKKPAQTRVVQGLFIAGGLYASFLLGRKLVRSLQTRNTQAMVDQSPVVRQAMSLKSAMNPSGTSWLMWSDGTKEDAIRQIATQITNMDAVNRAYRNLYQRELLSDLQSELSTADLNAFLQTVASNRVNSSSSSSTNSNGAYTTATKLVVAKKNVYVRTSPDASYHGAWYEVNGNKNIHKTAKPGEFVGYATGKQHYDSKNNVKFIEVAYRMASTGESKILWISSSSLYVDQFDSEAKMLARYPSNKGITQIYQAISGLGWLSSPGSRVITRCPAQLYNKQFHPFQRVKSQVLLGYPVMKLAGKNNQYTLVRTVQGLDRWVDSNNIINT
jgi:hypothetical protein